MSWIPFLYKLNVPIYNLFLYAHVKRKLCPLYLEIDDAYKDKRIALIHYQNDTTSQTCMKIKWNVLLSQHETQNLCLIN